jgi:cutinase
MRASAVVLSLLASVAAGSPIKVRQSSTVGITENEFTQGGCKPVIFFFARGSTEVGNMVLDPSLPSSLPPTFSKLT